MPKFLEQKLTAEYGPNNPGAVYGTMQAMGAMKGNRETSKGRAMQAKHDRDTTPAAGKAAALASHPHAARLGKFLHPKKAR